MGKRKVVKRVRKPKEDTPPPGKWVKSVGTLAQHLRKRREQLLRYRDMHGAPLKKTKWGYNVDAMRDWMKDHGYTEGEHSQRPDDGNVEDDSKQTTRDRLLSAP